MRILHIYKDYFPVVGGIENHVQMLAEGQAARGHDVTVLVTSLTRTSHVETRNGVRVIYASRWFNLSSAPFSTELFSRVRELQADVTHLHSPYPVGEFAQYFFGHTQKIFLTYHSDIVRQRVMGALYTPFLHRVLAGVNKIIATSPNYIESSAVLRRWKEKCVVVPLGIDALPFFNFLKSNVRDGNQLLFVGKLRYYKGLNYLLEAMPLVPNARLTVVGEGPMEQAWKELAQQLGVTERVNWIGAVPDEKLPAYYAACDIFVLPCSERSEAFGAVQLEAMASSKPVISCDVSTGVAWVNQDEKTGIVVPPKNPQALVDAIIRLSGDAKLRAEMGVAGKKRIEDEFTVDLMVERVLKVYES